MKGITTYLQDPDIYDAHLSPAHQKATRKALNPRSYTFPGQLPTAKFMIILKLDFKNLAESRRLCNYEMFIPSFISGSTNYSIPRINQSGQNNSQIISTLSSDREIILIIIMSINSGRSIHHC